MSTPSTIRTISPASGNRAASTADFDAIRLKLASPDIILAWSHGEVLKPDTINYRTQKPERDGLFCEKIFGPIKDWECACGKYKKIRYKGIVCDRCGVEVVRSVVRRSRMGHIRLAVPVSHIWFLRGVPSKVGLILDLSVQNLEKIIYFANFIITKVDEDLKKGFWEQAEREYKTKKKSIEKESSAQKDKEEKLKELKESLTSVKKELDGLKPKSLITKQAYQELALKYGHIFEAEIGAEAIRKLLTDVNLEEEKKRLEKEISSGKKSLGTQKKSTQRLKLIKNFIRNNTKPEWMILTIVPVIPADIRPMVQLDGGRFASSDLNDLYRRVINRNNRLKRLIELNAPEVICCNEKRMLQEAVDALIDNSARHGKTVTASTGQKRTLKSLADILKGKEGRFRQNLLGKRVDYSGRSVIVVGPHLKLHQCGLPKTMAIELFKPFVISQLIKRGYVHNVRSASRMIEDKKGKEIWDILEEITKKSYVLLNRAPTLHRLGIQAFQPILIEGKAIQVHPLVCPPFNADFDGDQMAVHVPLTREANEEAAEIMLSSKNLLKPATGEPSISPDKDMVLGAYYMTLLKDKESQKGENSKENAPRAFYSPEDAIMAYNLNKIGLNEKIRVRIGEEMVETGVGRVIINSIFPEDLRKYDKVMEKKSLREIIGQSLESYGTEKTAVLLDDIKKLTLKYLTMSGISWGMDDLPVLSIKNDMIAETEKKVEEIKDQYEAGLLTDNERYGMVIEKWHEVTNQVAKASKEAFKEDNTVFSMITSGARGSWVQVVQMMGMKGLVANPAGETIELPIKSNFKEGFDVLEYFISTHGARKGLADTALRTASAGYLTRRLVDVAHEVIVTEEDCGDEEGIILTAEESKDVGESLINRITGRVSLENIKDPKTSKAIVKKGDLITKEKALKLAEAILKQIRIRSVLSCQSTRGVCQKCYGYDLGRNKLVDLGTAVGVIAAQSIGEPGTQLTMRTFHTGGVAGKDITQGLPLVEEIFEARPAKGKAMMSEVDGKIHLTEENGQKKIEVEYKAVGKEEYDLKEEDKVSVKDKGLVKKGDLIFKTDNKKATAKHSGIVSLTEKSLKINYEIKDKKEYAVPHRFNVWVKEGDLVAKGDQLTEGSLDLLELYTLKGREVTQRYLINKILHLYFFQGQKLNNKHVEVIAKQMFSRIHVKDAKDTDLISGITVTRSVFLEANKKAVKEGNKPATGEELLQGITKVSLTTESFLSAASFQETARVLIDAAITEKVDKLRGLKENVIIGRLIPVGTGFRKQ